MASVVRGVISDTEPTKVVLPTPKPPATTILTEVMARFPRRARTALELAKSTEHPFEQVKVRAAVRVIDLVHPDQPLDRHVRDQDTRHPQGHSEYGGISATERQSRQKPRIAWHSGLRTERSRAS